MAEKMEVQSNKMNSALKNVALYVAIGVLIGGLAGATTMLFVAPESGKRTRALVKNKTIRLRDQTTKNIKKAVVQVRTGTGKLSKGISEKAVGLKQLGQEKLVQQLDRVSKAIDAGKSAVESA
jgi:gas vesicle protein